MAKPDDNLSLRELVEVHKTESDAAFKTYQDVTNASIAALSDRLAAVERALRFQVHQKATGQG